MYSVITDTQFESELRMCKKRSPSAFNLVIVACSDLANNPNTKSRKSKFVQIKMAGRATPYKVYRTLVPKTKLEITWMYHPSKSKTLQFLNISSR